MDVGYKHRNHSSRSIKKIIKKINKINILIINNKLNKKLLWSCKNNFHQVVYNLDKVTITITTLIIIDKEI